MEISASDLCQHYASLSDEALREIDPAELTEVARQCYQVEVDGRGLKRGLQRSPLPVATSGSDEEPEIEPDWVENAACACSYVAHPHSNSEPDARRAVDTLLAAGIPCHLSVVPPDPQSEGSRRYDEYRVLVPAALTLKALSVLDLEIFNPDLEAEWRGHLAALSGEELREVKPEIICAGLLDRAERLRRAYEEEIAGRRQR